MNLSNGRIWPYAISISIIMVFGFCVATVVVTQKASIQNSDIYMTSYQDADSRANDIIEDRIAFDKQYDIQYITSSLNTNNSVIQYKITDKTSVPINGAELKIIVSRPDDSSFNIELSNPSVHDGVYTFEAIKLAKEGRWDVMAKVNVDKLQRFYNVKADTRVTEVSEY